MSTPVERAIAALAIPGEWDWRVDPRPRRRTLGIEVREDGSVRFAVPLDADPRDVADAVRLRLPRLAEAIRLHRDRDLPVKDLVSGTSFSYLGRRYRLRVAPGTHTPGVRLRGGWLEMPRPPHPAEGGRWLAQWYTDRGGRWLTARVPPLAARVGVLPEAVVARDLGEHWGICRPDGRITVHWAVLQLPPQLVDYVLLHELVHLRVAGHGAAFRRELRLALPNADGHARWFRSEERQLWRGAVTGS